MATTIVTKNSSTASAVPSAANLVQGELAVNVTDKRLFTENAAGTVVELGTTPSSVTTGAISGTTITASSTLGVTGTATFSGALVANGNTTIGNADTDTITQTASYVTGTQLKSAKTATNTLNLAAYDTDGAAYTNLVTLTASTTPTLALTSTGVGTINNMSIGATTKSTGAFTTLSASGVASFADGSAAAPSITNTGDTNTGILFPAADTVAVSTAGTERMRITSAGYVGIGTSSPAVRLDVAGSNQTAVARTYAGSTSFTQYIDDSAGGVYLAANTASGTNAKFLAFQTVPSGGAATERARIDSSGNVLFNSTTLGFANQRSVQIQTQSTGLIVIQHLNTETSGAAYVWFTYNGGPIGSITQNGTTAISYNTTSDYRLKENVQPLTGALARVAALKPCTYTWKSAPDEIGEGFLAHELAEVCPQAVTGEKDDVETYTDEEGSEQTRPKYQSIDTSFLVATLTAAIQELKAELDAAKADIATLKGN